MGVKFPGVPCQQPGETLGMASARIARALMLRERTRWAHPPIDPLKTKPVGRLLKVRIVEMMCRRGRRRKSCGRTVCLRSWHQQHVLLRFTRRELPAVEAFS